MTDLTTVAAVKSYSGITTSADDAVIQSLVSAYSDYVRTFTSRNFTADNFEIYRDGRNSMSMLLPEYPVIDVSLLEIDGKEILPQAAFGQPGYRFTDRQIFLDGYRFCWGHGNVHVIFSAGYLTVPNDIAQAVNELVGLRYSNRDDQGWVSKQLAGETVTLNTKDMPASVMTILQKYARKVPM